MMLCEFIIMIIVAIDPGLKHLGWSMFDSVANSFISFGVYDLVKDVPKKEHTKYAQLIKRFVNNSSESLDRADVIVIEIQMMARFKVIATALQCFYWEKHIMVAPKAVRYYYNISTGNYNENKKKSIEFAPSLLGLHGKQRLEGLKKKDDAADAIILACYYNDRFNKKCKKRKR